MDGQEKVQVDHEGEEEDHEEVDREEVELLEALGQALLANQVQMLLPIDHLAAE